MNITTTSLSVPELSGHVMGGVPGTNSSPGHGGGGGNDCKISVRVSCSVHFPLIPLARTLITNMNTN